MQTSAVFCPKGQVEENSAFRRRYGDDVNFMQMVVLKIFSQAIARLSTGAGLETATKPRSEPRFHKISKAEINAQVVDPETQQPVKETFIDGLLYAAGRRAPIRR